MTVVVFEDGDTALFVAYAPQLDISSCGETREEARQNLREAVRALVRFTRAQQTKAPPLNLL